MGRPSFQFYPADWSGNNKLRRCTHAEKGVWIDIICLFNDSEEYGVLRWSLKEIASAVGCNLSLVNLLVTKGVLRGCPAEMELEPFVYVPRSGRKDGEPVTLLPAQSGPIWFSSRMVKDEHVRKTAGASTRFGVVTTPDNKKTPSRAPSRRQGVDQGDGSSSSSSSSLSVSRETVAAATIDPAKIYFDTGVLLLTELGAGKSARSLLAKLRQGLADDVGRSQAVIDEMATVRPADPASWLMARARSGPSLFDQKNDGTGRVYADDAIY